MDQDTLRAEYTEACALAAASSKKDQCTLHVCAVVGMDRTGPTPTPCITGFNVGDWYDGTVLSTYHNGLLRD